MDALALLQFTTPAAQSGNVGTSKSSDAAGAFLQMIQSLTGGGTPLVMNGTPVSFEGVRVGEEGKPVLTDEATMTAMSLLMSQFAAPMQPQAETVTLTEGEAVEGIDAATQMAAAVDPALIASGEASANGVEGETPVAAVPAQAATTNPAAIAEAAKSADDAAKLTVQATQEAADAGKTAESAQEPESVVKTLKKEHAASAEADSSAINQDKTAEAKAKAETGSQNGHNNGNSFEHALKAAAGHTTQANSSNTEASGTFASAVQNASTDVKTQQAEAPATHTRQPQQPIPATLDTVSVHLHKAVASKTDRMTIQLRPLELGKIEVQLEFSPDGLVQASIAAERPETLELLQKDSRSLERALQDAGVQTNSNSLNFSLRGQGGNGGQGQFGQQAFGENGTSGSSQDANPQGEDVTQAALAALNKTDGGNRRLNITV